MSGEQVKIEAACCPECGVSIEDTDFTTTIREAIFYCRFEDGRLAEERVEGWSGEVVMECGECGWGGDYYELVPASAAPKRDEED